MTASWFLIVYPKISLSGQSDGWEVVPEVKVNKLIFYGYQGVATAGLFIVCNQFYRDLNAFFEEMIDRGFG